MILTIFPVVIAIVWVLVIAVCFFPRQK